LEKIVEIDLLLSPPGLLILGLTLGWRRWSWAWRLALTLPLALALFAVMKIWTAVFGTNLTEYEAQAMRQHLPRRR
jgi:hypothetical protein